MTRSIRRELIASEDSARTTGVAVLRLSPATCAAEGRELVETRDFSLVLIDVSLEERVEAWQRVRSPTHATPWRSGR